MSSTVTTTTYETTTYAFPGFASFSSKLFPFRWILTAIGIIFCVIGFCLFVASPAILVSNAGYIDPGVVVMGFFGIFLFFIGGLLILCGCFTHRYYYSSSETPLVTVNGPVGATLVNEHNAPPPKKPPVGGFTYTPPQRSYNIQN